MCFAFSILLILGNSQNPQVVSKKLPSENLAVLALKMCLGALGINPGVHMDVPDNSNSKPIGIYRRYAPISISIGCMLLKI